MTDSACWITRNDGFGGEEKIYVFGPAPKPYWITLLYDWARKEQHPIEDISPLEIRAQAKKEEIISFIEHAYGRGVMCSCPVVPLLHDGEDYWINADEF